MAREFRVLDRYFPDVRLITRFVLSLFWHIFFPESNYPNNDLKKSFSFLPFSTDAPIVGFTRAAKSI